MTFFLYLIIASIKFVVVGYNFLSNIINIASKEIHKVITVLFVKSLGLNLYFLLI